MDMILQDHFFVPPLLFYLRKSPVAFRMAQIATKPGDARVVSQLSTMSLSFMQASRGKSNALAILGRMMNLLP